MRNKLNTESPDSTSASSVASSTSHTPYLRQYAWKVKKYLPKNPEHRANVLGYMVKKNLKNPKCRKHLEFEIPELTENFESNDCLHSEVAMASKFSDKKQFSKVKEIHAKIKKKYSSLRKASKLMKGISWKCVHKIFNPKELHVERQIKAIDDEDVCAFFLNAYYFYSVAK